MGNEGYLYTRISGMGAAVRQIGSSAPNSDLSFWEETGSVHQNKTAGKVAMVDTSSNALVG
jgi:hypothetical protein